MAKYKAVVEIRGELEVEFDEKDMTGFYPKGGKPNNFAANNAVFYKLNKEDLNLMENVESTIILVYDKNDEVVEELSF